MESAAVAAGDMSSGLRSITPLLAADLFRPLSVSGAVDPSDCSIDTGRVNCRIGALAVIFATNGRTSRQLTDPSCQERCPVSGPLLPYVVLVTPCRDHAARRAETYSLTARYRMP